MRWANYRNSYNDIAYLVDNINNKTSVFSEALKRLISLSLSCADVFPSSPADTASTHQYNKTYTYCILNIKLNLGKRCLHDFYMYMHRTFRSVLLIKWTAGLTYLIWRFIAYITLVNIKRVKEKIRTTRRLFETFINRQQVWMEICQEN